MREHSQAIEYSHLSSEAIGEVGVCRPTFIRNLRSGLMLLFAAALVLWSHARKLKHRVLLP